MPRLKLFLSLLLAFSASSARPALAQKAAHVSEISVISVFGEQFAISGRIEPGQVYASAAIQIQFQDDNRTLTAPLQPDENGSFTFIHRIAEQFVTAFSTVTFAIVLEQEGGVLLKSEFFSFLYTDNRLEWRSLESAPFTVHWYVGELDFAQQVLDAAQAGLDRSRSVLEIGVFDPVNIYVYGSLGDYQFSRGQFGRLWAGGHADPASGTVIVSLPPGSEAGLEIDRKIPHEIAHVAMYQAAGEGFRNLPVWLNEGFASVIETYPNPDYEFLISTARGESRLLSIAGLCDSFPAETSDALLAYAESASLVRYIENTYGPAGVRALVESHSSGTGCAQGTLAPPIALGLNARNGLAGCQSGASGSSATGEPMSQKTSYPG
jgi:hypothetical protein